MISIIGGAHPCHSLVGMVYLEKKGVFILKSLFLFGMQRVKGISVSPCRRVSKLLSS